MEDEDKKSFNKGIRKFIIYPLIISVVLIYYKFSCCGIPDDYVKETLGISLLIFVFNTIYQSIRYGYKSSVFDSDDGFGE